MRIALIILCIVFSSGSFGQMKAEDVGSEEEMNDFLDQYYFAGKRNDTLVTYKPYIHPVYQYDAFMLEYIGRFKTIKWIKTDFNNDNKKDLVFCGFFNDDSRVIVFLSGKKGYEYSVVSNDIENHMPYFIKVLPKNNFLVLTRLHIEAIYDPSIQFKDRIAVDTLKFEEGRFIDHDFGRSKTSYKINKISFRYSIRHFMVDFELTSWGGGFLRDKWEHHADSTEGMQKNKYSLAIDKRITDSLFDYFNKIQFRKYRDWYFPMIGLIDPPAWDFEFIYTDGKTKKISDTGECAPIALRSLYDYFRKLMRSDDWKLILTREND